MRKTEFKTCRKCNSLYRWESGGIVMTPADHMDNGLCPKCRTKDTFGLLGKLFGTGKKNK